jgi:hypothetical protein
MKVDLSDELEGYNSVEFDTLNERMEYLVSKLTLAMGGVVPAMLRALYNEWPGTPLEDLKQDDVEFFFTSALNAVMAERLRMRFRHNIDVATFLKQTEMNVSNLR